jgi:hypothetical protein
MVTTIHDEILAAVMAGMVTDKVAKEAKAALKSGTFASGELTLRVPFTLTKGDDYEVKPTVNLLSQAVIAKALVYSGVTADAFKAALLKAATEAFDTESKVSDVLSADDARILQEVARIQAEVVDRLPKQHRNGVVKVKAEPEVLKAEVRMV